MSHDLVSAASGALDDKPKARRIGRKVDLAITAMLNGAKTQTDAAAAAGMSREAFCRALKQPHVQAELQARVEQHLRGVSVVRAAGVLGQLLDAGSEHVRLKAAELVLAINGHRPPPLGVTVNTSVNMTPGWVIDLTPSDPPERNRAGGSSTVTVDVQPDGEAANFLEGTADAH